MIGTPVVTLPSAHTGGELVVDDNGQDRAHDERHLRLATCLMRCPRPEQGAKPRKRDMQGFDHYVRAVQ